MELYLEILKQIFLENHTEKMLKEENSLPELLECRSCQALREIKHILEDDSLSDPECFEKIEDFVCLFEELGSGCGNRHDFS